MDIDESGRDDEAAGIDHGRIAEGELAVGEIDGGHAAVFDHNVANAVETLGRIKHPPTSNDEGFVSRHRQPQGR